VAWNYNASKRTTFMTQYFGAKNKENAALYSLVANGGSSANGCNFGSNALSLAPGQDPQEFSMGIRHVF
jgi:hypothetical protein